MTRLADRSCPSAPLARGWESRGLVGWVCTGNPFYLLSACLVCFGLWVSFGSHAMAGETWALWVGMSAYTLLLAVTACLLVRFLRVWDDARTLLLLVVLMFLATSVTFDEVLARNPERGVACYLGGLLLAIGVSEAMLRSIRLELPALFRAPYYLMLGLFFLYPVALVPLLDQPRSEALSWALFGFSPLAALVSLTLLPAIRRGRHYVRKNGSPWAWPWYPWTVFGVLGFGAMGRSALLCWSMHHIENASREPYIFGAYFLVPLVLAIGVLLLEMGLVERRPGALETALWVPVICVILALVGHRNEVVYRAFLAQFSRGLGATPLYASLLAAVIFYAYAALRRVPGAADAFCVAVAGLALVGPNTLDLGGMVPLRFWPIAVAAAMQLAIGLGQKQSWRCLVGAGLAAVALTGVRADGHGQGDGIVAYHLVLAGIMAVGAAFGDRLGRALRTSGAVIATAGCLALISGRMPPAGSIPPWAAALYPWVVAAVLAGYGLALRHRASLRCAGVIVAFWLAAAGWRAYAHARHVVVGLDYIALGLLLFAVALTTSIIKGVRAKAQWRADQMPRSVT